MDKRNWLLNLKDESRGSDFTEAAEPLADSDIADESPIDSDIADESPIDSDIADNPPIDSDIADNPPIDSDVSDDSLIDYDVADDFEENMYEPESEFENTDDFSGFDGFKSSYDFENTDDFADFEGAAFLSPAAAQKQDLSFTESLKNFSYPRWLKSVLPQYFKPTLWMTALFFVTMAVGYAVGYFYPDLFGSLLLFDNVPEGGSFDLMLYIFFNNSRVLFMLVFFGFIFSILPLLIVVFNGFMIGIVSVVSIRHVGPAFLLTGILPHGIIEIPIILIGAGIGFRMGFLFTLLLLNLI